MAALPQGKEGVKEAALKHLKLTHESRKLWTYAEVSTRLACLGAAAALGWPLTLLDGGASSVQVLAPACRAAATTRCLYNH